MGPTPHREICGWWGGTGRTGSMRFDAVGAGRAVVPAGSYGPLTRTRAAGRTSLRSGRRPRSCELLELAADRLERRLDLAAEGGDDGHDHRGDQGDEHAVLDGGRTALAGDVHAGLEVVEQLLDVHGGWFSCGCGGAGGLTCPALQERGRSCGNP